MKFTPQKDKKARLISLAAVLSAACLAATVTLNVSYKVFYELAAFFLCILSIELLIRYVLTEYTYGIDEGNFTVEKRRGRVSQYICNLSLSTALALCETPKSGAQRKVLEKDFGHISVRYDFCQSMARKGAYSLFFEFNGKTAEVIFQPSEEMLTLLRERIEGNTENF